MNESFIIIKKLDLFKIYWN